MKHGILTLTLLASMLFAYAPNAVAHQAGSRTVIVYDTHPTIRYRGAAPRWLRAHKPFQRWYLTSRYRHARQVSWSQLYDFYRHDLRHTRPVRRLDRHAPDRHRHRYCR